MIRDKEENQYTFTARFGKQDKLTSLVKPSSGKPSGKLSKKPSSTNIKKDEIPIYTHCGYGKYRKYFYLYPKLRPED